MQEREAVRKTDSESGVKYDGWQRPAKANNPYSRRSQSAVFGSVTGGTKSAEEGLNISSEFQQQMKIDTEKKNPIKYIHCGENSLIKNIIK